MNQELALLIFRISLILFAVSVITYFISTIWIRVKNIAYLIWKYLHIKYEIESDRKPGYVIRVIMSSLYHIGNYRGKSKRS